MKTLSSPEAFPTFIRHLREALPYLEKFHNQTLVFHLEKIPSKNESSRIIEDLVLLRQVGLHVILVHGDAGDIQQLETDPETRYKEFCHSISCTNWDLQSRVCRVSRNFNALSGLFIDAAPVMDAKVEQEFLPGRVTNVNLTALEEALNTRNILIIPSFGIGEKGRLWLLDPGEVAMEIAAQMRAKKLITLGNGKRSNLRELPSREMSTREMRNWLKGQQTLAYSVRRSWESLTGACERGVERCHDLDSDHDGSILVELFTSGGVGLMITNSDYRKIRPAKISDLQKIQQLLEESSENGNLVSRTHDYLRSHINNFYVYSLDEKMVGCFEFQSEHEAEAAVLGSLAVALTQRNQGVGRELVQAAVNETKLRGLRNLYALTNTHSRIFLQCGFHLAKPEQLPAGKLRDFDHPTSQIYLHNLEQD